MQFCGDYCFQGDHGDYNKTAAKMLPDTSEQVAAWIEARMDELKPEQLTITFFGGEPLVNLLEAVYPPSVPTRWRRSAASS